MKWQVLALVVCLSSACGGSDESGFAGEYQITQIGENLTGCGNLTATTIPPEDEFFQLVDTSFYGTTTVEQHACTAPGVCEADSFTFYVEDGGDWVEEFSSADGLAMPCYVTVTRTTLGRVDDNNIELHTITQSGDINEFPQGCPRTSDDFLDWDAVEPFYDELPCVNERVVQATSTQQ